MENSTTPHQRAEHTQLCWLVDPERKGVKVQSSASIQKPIAALLRVGANTVKNAAVTKKSNP
jgi:hypothetical protein